jgi:hypothetical protein
MGGGKIWFKDPIEKSLNKPLQQTTFTEFVNYILSTPDHLRDIHFSTQSFLVEDITFNKIVKMETFAEDLKEAAATYSLPLAIPKHIQKNKTNYHLLNLKEITPEILDKIHHIYKADFIKFNHSMPSINEVKKYIQDKSFDGPVHQGPFSHQVRLWKK